jgi:hypothetical protein
MVRINAVAVFLLGLLPQLHGQTSNECDGAIRIGPGVTPPRVVRKVEPEYSADARAGHIQGTVILQVTVNEKGRPTGIGVLSPLGLDWTNAQSSPSRNGSSLRE